MAVRRVLVDREQEVERAGDVVELGHHRMLAVDHRERRGALLGEMHHGLRLGGRDEVGESLGIGEVDEAPLDVAVTVLTPAFHTAFHRRDGDERRGASLEVPAPAHQVVDRDDLVALVRQVHRLGPSEIAVRAEHNHRSVTHARSS